VPADVSVEDLMEIVKKRNLFLTGAAGTGKSYLTTSLINACKEADMQVVPLGSTGVSAVNIGGFTVHSFFVIGISSSLEEMIEQDRRNRKRLSELKRILKSTDLIIIDEISMIGAEVLEMIRYRLEKMNYTGRLMFVGDFYQLPPVVKKTDLSRNLFAKELYAFESSAWKTFDPYIVELFRVHRTDDAEFIRILSKIRRGERSAEVTEYLLKLCNNETVYAMEPTYLFGRNIEVEKMNRESLASLDTQEYLLRAETETEGRIHEKRLEKWKKALPIQEELYLKIGAPVLFTVNRWGRYVNGERGILRSVEDEFLIVEKDNEYIRVERHEFSLPQMEIDAEGGLMLRPLAVCRQFPLKLAYAVTIHKSQGMSIDRLVCNVDTIFAPSQFYVAVSRATDPEKLKIDFNRGDLELYLEKTVRVDERVNAFYEEAGV
jgi:ATP-dependent exoDNAse (exonuclease V) alpha subunit